MLIKRKYIKSIEKLHKVDLPDNLVQARISINYSKFKKRRYRKK